MATISRVRTGHHSVYVVYLRNPRGDGKAGYYVGMTGLSPEQRFENHKNGIKAARVVRKFGERLVPVVRASEPMSPACAAHGRITRRACASAASSSSAALGLTCRAGLSPRGLQALAPGMRIAQ